MIRLTFLGAAGAVTGSKYRLSVGGREYLIDCGLFQGSTELEEGNWQPLPFEPSRVQAVVLTHAHLDHSGWVPRLVSEGYRGRIYASEPTIALLGLLLPDAARLEEEQAEYANRKQYSRHQPALPLYTEEDAEAALRSMSALPVDKCVAIDECLSVTLRRAGHILGSAIVECEVTDGDERLTIVFSGDLGRYDQPVMRDPAAIAAADYLVVESTYGDRHHDEEQVDDRLAELITAAVHRRGTIVIPAFAVGRAQEVLYHVRQLEEAGRIPNLPVYVDSPMAIDATSIYCRFGDEHNLRVSLLMDDDRCPLRCHETHFVRTVDASKRLNELQGPAIVISASGMCNGGRVVHHLKHRLPDPRSTILFVGYQAVGTRGRALVEGAREVRIHGQEVPVRARIEVIDGLSAHADQDDLQRWLSGFEQPPATTFVVHGEPEASATLTELINQRPGWHAVTPSHGDSIELHGRPR